MKILIGSLTALALVATPALAQTNNTAASSKPAPTMKSSKPSVTKEAKTEGESTATEAKEHKAAARHHHKGKSRKHKGHHKMASKKSMKPAATTPTK